MTALVGALTVATQWAAFTAVPVKSLQTSMAHGESENWYGSVTYFGKSLEDARLIADLVPWESGPTRDKLVASEEYPYAIGRAFGVSVTVQAIR